MFYELLDIATGNLIGTYDSEVEALAVVCRAARPNEPAYVAALALGYEDGDGEGAQIAAGVDLREWALAGEPDPLSRPA